MLRFPPRRMTFQFLKRFIFWSFVCMQSWPTKVTDPFLGSVRLLFRFLFSTTIALHGDSPSFSYTSARQSVFLHTRVDWPVSSKLLAINSQTTSQQRKHYQLKNYFTRNWQGATPMGLTHLSYGRQQKNNGGNTWSQQLEGSELGGRKVLPFATAGEA